MWLPAASPPVTSVAVLPTRVAVPTSVGPSKKRTVPAGAVGAACAATTVAVKLMGMSIPEGPGEAVSDTATGARPIVSVPLANAMA